ncbi:MAG: ferritin-like domain-containing protein [Rhodocyclaceae bacterium]|nr:ferritin-like domain-containing protein [Rhodocyclaceae bacterium]
MSHPDLRIPKSIRCGRRAFVASGLTLSAAAIALLGGRRALAARQPETAGSVEADIRILNSALQAEQRAVAAYQLGADSGLLRAPAKALAVQFQGHHRAHAALLEQTVGQLGGRALPAATDHDFAVDALRTEADVLRFAASLEQGAVSAYLAAVPGFDDRELAHAAASILGDEAMHWAVLRQVLGEPPVPVAFVT